MGGRSPKKSKGWGWDTAAMANGSAAAAQSLPRARANFFQKHTSHRVDQLQVDYYDAIYTAERTARGLTEEISR